eukprot:4878262-Pleurochrysis_carterae.AAC.2
MAFILAKRHSVPEDSHRAATERRESLKVGTHLTSLSVSHSHGAPSVVQRGKRHVSNGSTRLGSAVYARHAVIACTHVH